jgi:hypothetical protein
LIPAQITGRLDESSDGVYYRVPKRDLVTGLHVLFNRCPFETQSDAPGVDALIPNSRISELGRPGAATCVSGGTRDDLTMALALAWWWMRKRVAWRGPASPLSPP